MSVTLTFPKANIDGGDGEAIRRYCHAALNRLKAGDVEQAKLLIEDALYAMPGHGGSAMHVIPAVLHAAQG